VGIEDAGAPRVLAYPGRGDDDRSLGAGFANGVGMAMAERFLAGRYNRIGHEIVDHHVYAHLLRR
jgi:transketolase